MIETIMKHLVFSIIASSWLKLLRHLHALYSSFKYSGLNTTLPFQHLEQVILCERLASRGHFLSCSVIYLVLVATDFFLQLFYLLGGGGGVSVILEVRGQLCGVGFLPLLHVFWESDLGDWCLSYFSTVMIRCHGQKINNLQKKDYLGLTV